MIRFILVILIMISIGLPVYSQKDSAKKDPMASSVFSGLKFRSIGPALASGRVIDLAVNPNDNSIIYAAVACGGIWKTTNSGIKWTPIFDNYPSFSIGCLQLDPCNPNVIWAGSGENNSQRSVSWGDGIYRSIDGGKSWTNMGLKKSEHIGKIVINPKDPNMVYVAAQGPLWGPGGDRGLYKTTDGGKTWEQSLKISENTGVSDIVMDPRDPNVLYASSYQRRRHVWTLINGGPEGAIYKTVDGGKTWDKLTSGLPGGYVGRIGLAIAPSKPDIVYALIEAAEDAGGFFKTTDRGASWSKVYNYQAGSAQYYQELFCDPIDPDKVFSVDTYTKYTEDGGKTWKNLGLKERHVDDHALWIDPKNTRHLFIGGDGGIYETFDHGETWRFFENLPITQFYRVAVDNTYPFYYVYGGTQDNATIGGPSRTMNTGGIMNQDWFFTKEGDGFQTRIDPKNPDIVYSQAQYGSLVRFDRKSGERIDIQPQEDKGEELRWNWDSPLIISPHSNTRLYFAANKLFRSDDMGSSWKKISGDLSRQIDRNQLEVMGKIWDPEAVAKNASTSLYGNIVALSESPMKENLVYVGTDDGLIQVTENSGESWSKVESFSGVPEKTYVSDIFTSQHDENVVYACFDNHKMADFKPYVLRSDNKGKSWISISSNLPENGPAYCIVEDHKNKNLLFVGTEFGIFFSVDGGAKWTQLKGGLPTIPIKDIEIQKRENDIVLATFGRSFYVLDNYSALQETSKETIDAAAKIFSVRDPLMFVPDARVGGRRDFGEEFYRAENPDFGAQITYYLKEGLKSKKDIRKEAEKASKEGNYKYPTFEQLRAEDLEEKPYIMLEIADESGYLVKRIKAPASAGYSRITWDLCYPDTRPLEASSDPNKSSGMPVLPGRYQVSMFKFIDGQFTKLDGPVFFTAKVISNATVPGDINKVNAFHKRLQEAQRVLTGTDSYFKEIKEQMNLIRKSLAATAGVTQEMLLMAKSINDSLVDVERFLYGDESKRKRNENQPPTVFDRLERMFYYTWMNLSDPPQTYLASIDIAETELSQAIAKMKNLQANQIAQLEKEMDRLNAPWTPGRVLELKK